MARIVHAIAIRVQRDMMKFVRNLYPILMICVNIRHNRFLLDLIFRIHNVLAVFS